MTRLPHQRSTASRGRLRWVLLAWLLAFSAIVAPAHAAGSAGNTSKSKKSTSSAEPEIVWPLPPDPPRVRYLRAHYGSQDYENKKKKRWRRLFLGPEPEKVTVLVKPYGVATDGKGRLYVTDTGLGAVVIFDDQERTVRILGDRGHVQLSTPIGIAIDAQERIFVADSGLHQVICFSPEGKPLMAIGRDEGLQSPSGVAIDEARGRLLVTDSHQHKIFVYGLDGALAKTWGARGSGDGEFNFPTNIAVGSGGHVYVVDTGNFRVQVLGPEGDFLSKFGRAGDGFGDFHRPKGIAVDSEGHVYVVDAAFNNFQVFDSGGTLLLFVGAYGKDPGRFWVPAGIHIDGEDRIFVADQVNARIQVFQYLPETNDVKPVSRGEPAESAGL